MKNKIIFFTLLCLLGIESIRADNAYLRATSLTTQLPEGTGRTLVKMDSVDEIKNAELTNNRERVTVKEPGIYFITSSGQVGAISPGAKGYIDMWFEKNGKPVVNSTSRMTLTTSTDTAPMTNAIVIALNAGDTIATAYAASGPSLGFVFLQPANEPACASFLFSLFKINNL